MKKRFTEEQMLDFLKQAEAGLQPKDRDRLSSALGTVHRAGFDQGQRTT